MNQYISITSTISIHKDISPILIPIILYRCKPLMPRNPLKRIKLSLSYFLFYLKRDSIKFSIPVKGDIALKVGDSNYKIIVLKKNIIYTLFNQSTEEGVYRTLEHKNTSRMYEQIFQIDRHQRTIKGTFYNGHHPNLFSEYNKYKKPFLELFCNLILGSEVREVNTVKYAYELLERGLEILDRSVNKIPEKDYIYTEKFLNKTYENCISNKKQDFIKLILSHGDIKQDNIITLNNKFVLIDWEFCDFRSPIYDLVKFKSRFPHLGESFFRYLFEEVQNSLQFEGFHHKGMSSYFQNSGDEYLNIYYLEDIVLRLSQFEDRSFARDFTTRIIHPIKKIEWGIVFEKNSNF